MLAKLLLVARGMIVAMVLLTRVVAVLNALLTQLASEAVSMHGQPFNLHKSALQQRLTCCTAFAKSCLEAFWMIWHVVIFASVIGALQQLQAASTPPALLMPLPAESSEAATSPACFATAQAEAATASNQARASLSCFSSFNNGCLRPSMSSNDILGRLQGHNSCG